MSEELLQATPVPVGRYVYHRLGATTLGQLAQAGIVGDSIPGNIRKNKPDGLITLGKGVVKAYIEYKTPAELNTTSKVKKTVAQVIEPAKHMCNLLIVTDGQKTHWFNPHTRKPVQASHPLPVFDAKPIVGGSASTEYLKDIEEIIDQANHSLSSDNNVLWTPSLIDPSDLAQKIWQRIWINTGKEPEKCLYNVVELFVFKYLSDLSVLKPHNNFAHVYAAASAAGHVEALTIYANISRPAIQNLFPEGNDGTSIINGTIFVNEKGEPNKSQALLFCEVLNDLQEFDVGHGSFRYIRKEFKTRLYESFLRQGAGLHHLGQFFTPRNVVQAVVGMSGADTLSSGASVCDPFCGVGGFLLEAILQSQRLMACFKPQDGVIEPDVSFVGYDRGSDEKEDERTIILAKANALIYFSDLISLYNTPNFSVEFANKVINPMFNLVRTNLGTFQLDHERRHDLILTNPPYVTRGSSSLKNAIQAAGIADRYSASGRGTESLAMQWIIRSLKPGGTAIVIVPDGLLNQKPMLEYVKERCIVKAIVSLPVRTFYATPKKTYLLILERKHDNEGVQSEPVFTYLVSEIGETRDANRWTIPENDLNEAVELYNQFKGAPGSFRPSSTRCKTVLWSEFDLFGHWMLDRICWSDSELLELGIVEDNDETLTISQFNKLLKVVKGVSVVESGGYSTKFSEVMLGDESLFNLTIGKRILKKDCVEKGIPCISANVHDVFGHIAESSLIQDFDVPSLTWGIDGVFDWHIIPAGYPFHPTDHCGVLRILHKDIDPYYLYHALRETKDRHGFDRTYRANLDNVSRVSVEIPVLDDGRFDKVKQSEIATLYDSIVQSKIKTAALLRKIMDARVTLLESTNG